MTTEQRIRADNALRDIDERIAAMWLAVELFTRNRDPHSVMDMGAELQALMRARTEVAKLTTP